MSTRLSGLFCLACILISLAISVNAQSAATASLTTPKIDNFPHIETYLDVHDAEGNFLHNLQAEHVRVLEDDASASVTSIRELRPGVQFVVALNPGPSMGVRNSQAVSRYDQVKSAVASWALNRQGSTLDDLSLQITNGPGITHSSDSLEFLKTLESDQQDARTADPNLDILFQAITIAADPTPRTGMGRIVLLITPPPDTQSVTSLENIFTQAKNQGIYIYVWMVASSGSLNTQGAQRLQELSEGTGGQFFAFTGSEILPDLEIVLEPLRSIYHIIYLSTVTSSGTHQMLAQIQIGGELISTAPQSFEINIQPPLPTFVSPPIQIVRSPNQDPESFDTDEGSAPELLPKEEVLQVVFDFPDGRLRPIIYSALIVDGNIVDENQEPPFDRFTWNLESYTEDGNYQLQVQVEDSLGLVGTSLEIPVNLRVEQPASENPWGAIQQNMPLLVGLIVLVAGAILVLVLLLGGQIKPRTPGTLRKRRRKSDPVTQPISTKDSSDRRLPNWINRLQLPSRDSTPQAYAFLSRISETDNLAIEPPIPITSKQVTIGIDPKQASLVLDHPSIEGLHAQLTQMEDGSFRLSDKGTIAGTWINYTPISGEGSNLEHGDLIHIGRLGFRFTIREPKQVRRPKIILEAKPDEKEEEPQS